ncbi:MAG TPA: potassium transporter Kef [Chromatiaceae bacterium]|nr:potassium transporter Kef [Chromatiaceae bacterium]
MDPLWLLIAFVLGLLAKQAYLPPMVGFLLAGFALHALGVQGGEVLQEMADLGVLLLLFTIGLKLRLRSLLVPEIWGSTCIHMSLTMLFVSGFIVLGGMAGMAWFGELDWQSAALVAFALSFSSTVFAVQVLEERGEMKTRHGQVSIGILVIQDIIAVVFLAVATGKMPGVWAFGLLLLPLLRPLLNKIMERSGHGELLVLFGLAMAMGGGELFTLTGMKDGLGALVFGALLGGLPKSNELARSLLRFKDLFLVGFFLQIGIGTLPGPDDILIAALLVLLILPIKTALWFFILTGFRLRARTSFLSAMELSSYSEFGLIVAAMAISTGWLDQEWLIIIALALTFSFMVAAIANAYVHGFYAMLESRLYRFQSKTRLPVDVPPDLGGAEILVAGMGRVGTGAYANMREIFGDKVIGIDANPNAIRWYRGKKYNVILGDAEDLDFWQNVDIDNLRLVMLAMPALRDMQQAFKLLRHVGYEGLVAAVTRFEDDRLALEKAGVDAVFNIYEEAGAGFAEHVRQQLSESGRCLLDEQKQVGNDA